jgi:putative ABC transport system substrate-binding protein
LSGSLAEALAGGKMSVAALEERARAAGLVDERQSISDLKPFKAAKRRSATRIAVLVNPTGPDAKALTQEAQSALRTMGRPIELLTAGTSGEIEMAFATLVQQRAEALLVTNSNLFANRAVRLIRGALQSASNVLWPGLRTGWWVDELRTKLEPESRSEHLCRPHPQGREAR